MSRYKCKVCGYIYNTESGEQRNGTVPGTEFDSLLITGSVPTVEPIKPVSLQFKLGVM